MEGENFDEIGFRELGWVGFILNISCFVLGIFV